jgi:hypothetical protein
MHCTDVDHAVMSFERRLNKIMACTSGMHNFNVVADKVTIYRAALELARAHDQHFPMGLNDRKTVIENSRLLIEANAWGKR